MIVMTYSLHVVPFVLVVIVYVVLVLLGFKITAAGHTESICCAFQAVFTTVAFRQRGGLLLLRVVASMGVMFMHVSYQELYCQARHFRRRIAAPAAGK